jgi:Ring finger domain
MPPNQHIPINKANIMACLFPIHPIASTSIALDGESCVICLEDFASDPGQIIAELHCNHIFHYTCVRDTWDEPSHLHGTKCPTCRSSGREWSLHAVAGIVPEVDNVLDYERVHEYPPPRLAYTRPADVLPQHYMVTENQRLHASRAFLEDQGYPRGVGGQRPEDGPAKSAEVEMALMRWARRKWNKERRNLVKHLGTGVHSLDPHFQ